MANALAHVAVQDARFVSIISNMMEVTGSVTIDPSPATYVSGGIAFSLSHPLIKAQRPPIYVDFQSLNGWQYAYVPGVDVTTGKLKIFTALGTELGNGNAIPAGNSGDTILFQANWFGQN